MPYAVSFMAVTVGDPLHFIFCARLDPQVRSGVLFTTDRFLSYDFSCLSPLMLGI